MTEKKARLKNIQLRDGVALDKALRKKKKLGGGNERGKRPNAFPQQGTNGRGSFYRQTSLAKTAWGNKGRGQEKGGSRALRLAKEGVI